MAARINLKIQSARPSKGRKVVLSDGQGNYVTLPFAPTGFTASGWARKWAELERALRENVLVDTGPGLRGVTFPITIGHANGNSISGILRDLLQLADAADVITITGLSSFELGPWRMRDVRVNVTHRTQTNEPRIAEVEIDLVKFTEFKARIGRSKPKKSGKRK